jgi:hypothetical protein
MDRSRYLRKPAPRLEPLIASLQQLHLAEVAITYYKDKPDTESDDYYWPPPQELAIDVYAWYHGMANDRQATFSTAYSRAALPTRKPTYTSLLTIRLGSLIDDVPTEMDRYGSFYCPCCAYVRTFAQSDMVKALRCYIGGGIRF